MRRALPRLRVQAQSPPERCPDGRFRPSSKLPGPAVQRSPMTRHRRRRRFYFTDPDGSDLDNASGPSTTCGRTAPFAGPQGNGVSQRRKHHRDRSTVMVAETCTRQVHRYERRRTALRAARDPLSDGWRASAGRMCFDETGTCTSPGTARHAFPVVSPPQGARQNRHGPATIPPLLFRSAGLKCYRLSSPRR